MSLMDFILGRPLSSAEERGEKLNTRAGIPVFGLDALSSAAYGPEAALTLLIPLGVAGIHYIIPVTGAIIVLLAMVYFSYRQTIEAYPTGGGSYTVARENLGDFAGLLAAAALMIDYVLTAAVGISAGVGALVSALPGLHRHTLLICLVILLLITLVNLRGVRSAGLAFLVPTYIFIATMLITLGWGVFKALASGGHPSPVAAPPQMHAVVTAVGAWVLIKAFSSGCTAMTGIEAVSNGVKSFRDPVAKTAQRTLTVIIVLLIVFLAGMAYLAHAYHIGATEPGSADYQSVLSQLIGAVAGRSVFYDISIGSILAALALSANTAFSDFPRVCRMVAEDVFLPVPFVQRGRRLVYSQGIYVLAIVCAALLIIFGGVTDRLIPLYAVGAFLAFTLSQSGMVAHWIRTGGARARRNMAINALGAVATAITVLVVTVSKFTEGAWITTLLIPAIIILMYSIRRHYDEVARRTAEPNPLSLQGCNQPLVVVPVVRWDKVTEKGLRFALTLSSDVQAVYVETDEGPDDLQARWRECVEAPATEAGLKTPPLNIVKSPYRFVVNPIVDFVLEIERKNPNRQVAVVVPELVEHHWYQYVLHNQRTKWLKALLLLKGGAHIVVITVPWYLAPPEKDGHTAGDKDK